MMMKRIVAAAVLLGACVAPLRAELKYTMRIEARPSSVPAPPSTNPMLGMIGAAVVGSMAPPGGLEMTVTVGERGTRVEYAKDYLIVPAGGATIVRPDGSMIVTNPAARTYWQMAKPDLSGLGATPVVTVRRTGEFSTVAGTRAERASMEIRVPLPAPAGAQLPPGIPTEMVLTGDVWLADQYRQYSKMSSGTMGASALGMDAMAAEGFVVRSIMRGEILGNQEIEAAVSNLAELAVPAELFGVPAGFTEVPPPAGMMPVAVPAKPAPAVR
jgi:hypothetical protein